MNICTDEDALNENIGIQELVLYVYSKFSTQKNFFFIAASDRSPSIILHCKTILGIACHVFSIVYLMFCSCNYLQLWFVDCWGPEPNTAPEPTFQPL